MCPSEESDDDALFCAREGVLVQADAPQCLHPSSYCEYRATCPVVDAQRQWKRAEEGKRGEKRG